MAEIRGLVADHGRTAAAWTVGPSATPYGLLELLVAMGLKSESDEGSLMLVLTAPLQILATPFEVRLVTSYEDHLARSRSPTRASPSRARTRWMSGDVPVPASSPSGPEGTACGC